MSKIKGWGVALPKSDILFWVGPPKLDIIGYGWVDKSKMGKKIGYPFWMAPNPFMNDFKRRKIFLNTSIVYSYILLPLTESFLLDGKRNLNLHTKNLKDPQPLFKPMAFCFGYGFGGQSFSTYGYGQKKHLQ